MEIFTRKIKGFIISSLLLPLSHFKYNMTGFIYIYIFEVLMETELMGCLVTFKIFIITVFEKKNNIILVFS